MIVNLAIGETLTASSYDELRAERDAIALILPMYRFQIKACKGKAVIKRTR